MERARTASHGGFYAIVTGGQGHVSLRRCSLRRQWSRRVRARRSNEAARKDSAHWCGRRVRGHNFRGLLGTVGFALRKRAVALSILPLRPSLRPLPLRNVPVSILARG